MTNVSNLKACRLKHCVHNPSRLESRGQSARALSFCDLDSAEIRGASNYMCCNMETGRRLAVFRFLDRKEVDETYSHGNRSLRPERPRV